MNGVLEKLWEILTSAGLKIIFAAVIVIVGLKLTNLLCDWLKRNEKFNHLDESLRSFLRSLISITLRVLVFVSAALTLGIPATSFVTVLASAGVAIGLALQGALSNLAGGIMILLFKPFKIGDFIETANGSGVVRNIAVFYTTLMTLDNRQVTLPNGSLTNAAITNYSVENSRRLDVVYTVAYNSDLELVKRTLRALADSEPMILKDPEPAVFMSAQKDSALEYTLRVWCEGANYLPLSAKMYEAGKIAFDKAGISIPYPQMDVHLDSLK